MRGDTQAVASTAGVPGRRGGALAPCLPMPIQTRYFGLLGEFPPPPAPDPSFEGADAVSGRRTTAPHAVPPPLWLPPLPCLRPAAAHGPSVVPDTLQPALVACPRSVGPRGNLGVSLLSVEWSCSPTFSPLLGEAVIDKLKNLHFTIRGLVSVSSRGGPNGGSGLRGDSPQPGKAAGHGAACGVGPCSPCGIVPRRWSAELRAWGRERRLSVPARPWLRWPWGNPLRGLPGAAGVNGAIHRAPDLSSVPHPAPVSARAPPGQ